MKLVWLCFNEQTHWMTNCLFVFLPYGSPLKSWRVQICIGCIILCVYYLNLSTRGKRSRRNFFFSLFLPYRALWWVGGFKSEVPSGVILCGIFSTKSAVFISSMKGVKGEKTIFPPYSGSLMNWRFKICSICLILQRASSPRELTFDFDNEKRERSNNRLFFIFSLYRGPLISSNL